MNQEVDKTEDAVVAEVAEVVEEVATEAVAEEAEITEAPVVEEAEAPAAPAKKSPAAKKPATKKPAAKKAPAKKPAAKKPAAKAKAEKPAKAPKAKKKAAPKKPAAERDQFGFRKGSKKSEAAKLYASKKGATLAEVKEKTGSSQLNLLKELETAGVKIERIKEAGKGKKQVTRYKIVMPEKK